MRRVVRGDRLDGPVPQRLEQCQPILLGPQGRVHLHVRVERADRVVGEDEVVRCRFAARGDAGHPRPAERVDRLGGREMEDVDTAPLVAGQ